MYNEIQHNVNVHSMPLAEKEKCGDPHAFRRKIF